MSKETIVIDVMSDGSVHMEAQGFSGNACSIATEKIELVLGGQAKKTKKPEFFQPNSTAQTIKRNF